MNKRFVSTGLIAGVVGVFWIMLTFGILPIRDSMGWKPVPRQDAVLNALDENLPETGLYLVPAPSQGDSLFRARHRSGPFFRVHSLRTGSGGPERALISILAVLLAPIIPAWFVQHLCRHGRPPFWHRVGAVSLFGVFLALTAHLQLWGMELYPFRYSIFLTVHGLVTWVLMGLVVAWRIEPQGGEAAG